MPRKFMAASDAAREALGFVSGSGTGDAVPWDVVAERLGELLRFLFSALQALVGELEHRAAAVARWASADALPAAAVAAAFLFLCCGCQCCCCFLGRRRRGPDGEEVVPAAWGGDGPVVRYRRGGGGLFSMHPNKPVVG